MLPTLALVLDAVHLLLHWRALRRRRNRHTSMLRAARKVQRAATQDRATVQ